MSKATSQSAISKYIRNPGRFHIHNARVIVIMNDSTIYNRDTQIRAHIETNDALVDIIWDDKDDERFFSTYNGKYSNTDIEFEDGVLIIHGINRKGEEICIKIF